MSCKTGALYVQYLYIKIFLCYYISVHYCYHNIISQYVLRLLVLESSYTVYYLGQASFPEKNNIVINERTM